MANTINYFIRWLIDKLPNSPFQSFIPYLDEVQWVMYANWFIPFENLVAITYVWLTIVAIYYGYRVAKTCISYVLGLVRSLV